MAVSQECPALSSRLCLFWVLHINVIIKVVAFHTVEFTWHHVFKVSPCYSTHQRSVSYGSTAPRWVDSHVVSSHSWGASGLAPSLSYYEQCCYERRHMSVRANTLAILLGAHLEGKLLGHPVTAQPLKTHRTLTVDAASQDHQVHTRAPTTHSRQLHRPTRRV